MLIHPQFDPVALAIGPLEIHWYGIMYLVAFACAAGLGIYRAKQERSAWSREEVMDMIFYAAMGVVIGGRLGFAIFYNFAYYEQNPIEILYLWQGGMSFHGGLIGVALALLLFARHTKRSFLLVADFATPLVGIGLAAGRFANFINGELWGRTTDVAWGMVFAGAGPMPRHPSQLYQMLLEGLILFSIVWFYSQKNRALGKVSGLFLVLYGVFRTVAEFFREPDSHIGMVLFESITMGQLLSLPMIILGLYLFFRRRTD